jgi:hypothetical protein
MLEQWIDLQKNTVNPALKKMDLPSRIVQANVFGNNFEFTSISPFEKFAVLDSGNMFFASPLAVLVNRALSPDASARLSEQFRKCITGQRNYVILRVNELSIPSDRNAAPLVSISTRVRIAGGKADEYENFIKTDLLPIYKKAKAEGKIAGYVVSRRSLGANNQERTQTVYLSKFSDMDGGPALTRMVGEQAAGKLLAKGRMMSTLIEQVVRRRVNELSF